MGGTQAAIGTTTAVAIALVSLSAVLLAIERLVPLRRRKRPSVHRIYVNAVITALGFAAAWLTVKPAAVAIAARSAANPYGLVQIPGLPSPARFVLAFLLMDYTFYWWHRATHEVPLLWRFHNVHHFDPDLDVTTSFRFHFGEIVISTVFRAAQVYIIGVTPVMLVAYQASFMAATMFHHSNIRMPLALERALNAAVVTPRMHGIHHSAVRDETNSNYGSVFRWWDALHRTLVLDIPQRAVHIGVPACMLPRQNRTAAALTAPFTRQPDYWSWPSGRASRRDAADRAAERARLAP